MGLIKKEERSYSEARMYLEQAIAADPSSPSMHIYIAPVYAACVVSTFSCCHISLDCIVATALA